MKLSTCRMQLLLASSMAYYGAMLLPSVAAFYFVPPTYLLKSIPPSTPTSCTARTPSRYHHHYYGHPTRLHSSSSDEGEEDEAISDELAKLIGKRASISTGGSGVAKAKEIEESTASLYEDKEGMDVFDMPELNFQRPVSENDGDDEDGGGGKKKEEEEGAIDYQADYEDENDFHVVNRIGFDTGPWGDLDQGFKPGKKLKKKEMRMGKFLVSDLKQTYKKLMESGITLAITSEHYGLSSRQKSRTSEHILGLCANFDYQPLLASSMANPIKSFQKGTGLRLTKPAIVQAIENSAERLGTASIDLYQVPSRMALPPNTVADALNTALDQGLIQHVGAINMSKSSMERFSKKLAKRGDGGQPLTSNRFEFSLVNRKAQKSGLIGACKYLGVIPIAANPLGDGLATGVYTAADPSGGEANGKQPFDFKTLDKWSSLHGALGKVKEKVKKRLEGENQRLNDRRSRYGGQPINTDFTSTQIAINYVVAKGCVPIPSIKNPKEADELIGCLGWGLTDDEVRMLDNAADMCDQGL